MSIGDNVRIKREQRGMTGVELAKACNVTPAMISHIETGRKQPSVDTLVAIAAALLCTVDDLVH
jgi:transcriptional regulator with XRE-family HTH domain